MDKINAPKTALEIQAAEALKELFRKQESSVAAMSLIATNESTEVQEIDVQACIPQWNEEEPAAANIGTEVATSLISRRAFFRLPQIEDSPIQPQPLKVRNNGRKNVRTYSAGVAGVLAFGLGYAVVAAAASAQDTAKPEPAIQAEIDRDPVVIDIPRTTEQTTTTVFERSMIVIDDTTTTNSHTTTTATTTTVLAPTTTVAPTTTIAPIVAAAPTSSKPEPLNNKDNPKDCGALGGVEFVAQLGDTGIKILEKLGLSESQRNTLIYDKGILKDYGIEVIIAGTEECRPTRESIQIRYGI